VALAPAPERRAAAAPAPAAKTARSEGFSIQVGAFSSEKAARQLADELGRQGYTAYLMDEGHGARWKVRVGPLGTRSEAEAISAKLKREQRLPTWIQANG
jgi:cell division septation protein DedD